MEPQQVPRPKTPQPPLQPPKPPPSRDFPVNKFGALGDGKTPDTEPIQKAIDTCTAQGGGTVRLPPGHYLSGSILLKNNVTLHLEEGAVLLGSTNPADYRSVDHFREGTGNELGYAFVSAVDATNIAVEGVGTIDGQGKVVLAALKSGERNRRPFLVRFVRCQRMCNSKDVRLRAVSRVDRPLFAMPQCIGRAPEHQQPRGVE